MRQTTLVMLASAAAAGASGQSIDLAASVDSGGQIAEFNVTGSFAQVGLDPDGLYDVNNPGTLFAAVDVFPNDTAFGLGSLGFDAGAVTGVGTEVVPATALDLSDLWTAGSATSDISDAALGLWFFDAPRSIDFGPLDAADTLTFVDGQIDSASISVPATVTIDYSFAGAVTTYTGSFSITGNQFSFAIDDTQVDVVTAFGPVPTSRLVVDLSGTIAAIPSPATTAVFGTLALAAARRRR